MERSAVEADEAKRKAEIKQTNDCEGILLHVVGFCKAPKSALAIPERRQAQPVGPRRF